jgi:hypothetical protein
MVASVTNETFQLPWCGAAGDAVWMAETGLAFADPVPDESRKIRSARCSQEISCTVGRSTGGGRASSVVVLSPWIISMDGAAAVDKEPYPSRALLLSVRYFAAVVDHLYVCNVMVRNEVLEGHDWVGGPVRSVCARLQFSR